MSTEKKAAAPKKPAPKKAPAKAPKKAAAPKKSAAPEPKAPEPKPAPKPAAPKPAAPKMRRVCLKGRVSFPGIDIMHGGAAVTVTRAPRIVTVAVADALLKIAKDPGNPYGLTPENVTIESVNPTQKIRG